MAVAPNNAAPGTAIHIGQKYSGPPVPRLTSSHTVRLISTATDQIDQRIFSATGRPAVPVRTAGTGRETAGWVGPATAGAADGFPDTGRAVDSLSRSAEVTASEGFASRTSYSRKSSPPSATAARRRSAA